MSFVRKSSMLLALFLVLAATGLFAAGGREQPPVQASRTVTDMRGRAVTLPARVGKVIALGACSLRLLSYLDAVDLVIAVEDQGHGREKTEHEFFSLATYRLAYPVLRTLPSIGDEANHEGIIAAAPDLVVSSTIDVAQLDQLQTVLGIPVFAIDADVELFETERFFDQLKILGGVLGRERRADDLVSGIGSLLADLQTRRTKIASPKKAYAGGMMFFGPADLLRTTGDYLPFALTGTVNVMPSNPSGNRQPYMTSVEDLVVAAPDYVFVDAANLNLARSGFAVNRRILEERVPAFARRDVYTNLVYKYYGTNWENQLANVYFAGQVLYPEIFSDVNFRSQAEAIWRLFFNVPLDYSTVVRLQRNEPGRVGWFE